MKKTVKVLLVLASAVLCLCLATACSLFGGGDKGATEKADLIVEMVSLPSSKPVYTGSAFTFNEKEIIVRVGGKTADYTQFDYDYANNTEVGTATLTVTAKESNTLVKGSVFVPFDIVKGAARVSDEAGLKNALADKNYESVTVSDNIALTSDVTVPVGAKLILLNAPDIEVNGTLTNNGVIELGDDTLDARLNILGGFVNNGVLSILSKGKLYIGGTLENSGTVENAGVVIADGVFLRNVTTKGNGKSYTRRQIEEADVTLEYTSAAYDEAIGYFTPEYETPADIAAEEFENNNKAGTARVTLTVSKDDLAFFGSVTLEFTIEKALYSANDITLDDLQAKIDSGNYYAYNIGGTFTVPENKTLTVADGEIFAFQNLNINGTLTNNGSVSYSDNVIISATGALNNNAAFLATSTTCGLETKGALTNSGKLTTANFWFVSGTFVNSGKIGMTDAQQFADGCDNANGVIIANNAIAGFDVNVTVRKSFSAQDVVLDQTEFTYDGRAHKPTFTVNGVTLDEDDYILTYYYTTVETPEEPTRAGTVKLEIKIKNTAYACPVQGTVVVTYSIAE